MKKILFMMLAAMAIVGCEKETVEEIPQVDDNSISWDYPANLPDNIDEIITSAPCWEEKGFAYSGFIIDDKAVILDTTLYWLSGDSHFTFKFHSNKQLDTYTTYSMKPEATPIYIKSQWEITSILEYNDGKLVFASKNLKNDKEITIYTFKISTQEHLDNLISRISNSAE